MKFLKLLFAVMVAMFFTVSGNAQNNSQKVLVLYYSQTSNTKLVAEEFARRLNADMEEIVPVNPYDGDFNETIQRCMQERKNGIIPDIKPLKSDLSKYDVLFIGYPIWFGTYAPPIARFLQEVDLSEKIVVPFCTFGSGGLESSMTELFEKQPNAQIVAGYGVRAARLDAMPAEVDQFLKINGFIDGEYVKLGAFPMPHPVSAEEVAIFEAATGDYPMMHATAKKVASREIPNGTEYYFVAEDKPREAREDMPPAGELYVYVIVVGDEKPVFTKVVR